MSAEQRCGAQLPIGVGDIGPKSVGQLRRMSPRAGDLQSTLLPVTGSCNELVGAALVFNKSATKMVSITFTSRR
jgi:hypothetical protein